MYTKKDLDRVHKLTLINRARERHSCREFDKIEIDQELIDILVESINLSPISYGLQPVEFTIVTNTVTKIKLEVASYYQKQVSQSSHIIILSIRDDLNIDWIREHTEFLISRTIERNSTVLDEQGHLNKIICHKDFDSIEWAKNQAYLALGNLVSMCAQLEIDSCPMEGFDPDQVTSILKLDDKNLTPVLMLPIGYKSNKFEVRNKARKKLDSIVHYHK